MVPHSFGTGRNPVPSLCVQVIRERASSWLLRGDRGWRPPLRQAHTVPPPPGAAPGVLAGRAVHPGSSTAAVAGSAAGGSRRSPSRPAAGCCWWSAAPDSRECQFVVVHAQTCQLPGLSWSPAPPPPEVVPHPRCLPAGRLAGGPRGRRGEGVPGAAPPTSLFRPRCSLAPAPAATLSPGLSRKGRDRKVSFSYTKQGFWFQSGATRGPYLREEKPGLGSGSWGL